MPQDAFTLYHNARELNAALKGGKVNKINMPKSYEAVFYIYTGKEVFKLVISAEADCARVCITDTDKPNPLTPYNFCMLLRKHLTGAEIESVSLCGFERIIKISFKAKNDFFEEVNKSIYAEVMGKYSNIFLTENDKILGALKTASIDEGSKRALFNGSLYRLPPSQDKLEPSDKDGCLRLLSSFSGGDAARFLFIGIKGLAIATASNIVSGFYGGTDIAAFTDLERFYSYMYDCIYGEKITPFVSVTDKKITDFFAKGTLKPTDLAFETLSKAQDYYYTNKDTLSEFSRLKGALLLKMQAEEKKHQKRLAAHLEKLKECQSYEQNKILGELITANLYRTKQGDEYLTAQNYYEEGAPDIKIPLDKTLSPSQNAQKYYKKYNKQKKTIAAVNELLSDTSAQLDYIQGIIKTLNYCENILDLKEIEKEISQVFFKPIKGKNASLAQNKKKAETAFREYKIDGFTVRAGKNNLQNDMLVASAKASDIWLHTKGYHSCHVIIECKNAEVKNSVIQTAAEICAYFSEGKNGDKIPVDYCLKKYVKKPPKSRPGAVIYTDFKTCLVAPSPHEELLVLI